MLTETMHRIKVTKSRKSNLQFCGPAVSFRRWFIQQVRVYQRIIAMTGRLWNQHNRLLPAAVQLKATLVLGIESVLCGGIEKLGSYNFR